jgi:hypothetical protein
MIPQSVLCREIVEIFATLPLSILVGKLLACQVCCSCSETKWWTWVQVTEFHGITFMFERNHWIIFYCEKLMEVGTNRLLFKPLGFWGFSMVFLPLSLQDFLGYTYVKSCNLTKWLAWKKVNLPNHQFQISWDCPLAENECQCLP